MLRALARILIPLCLVLGGWASVWAAPPGKDTVKEESEGRLLRYHFQRGHLEQYRLTNRQATYISGMEKAFAREQNTESYMDGRLDIMDMQVHQGPVDRVDLHILFSKVYMESYPDLDEVNTGLRNLSDRPFRATMSDQGDLLQFDLSAFTDPGAFALAQNVKQVVQHFFVRLPKEPVKPGDTWARESLTPIQAPSGAILTQHVRYHHQYLRDLPCPNDTSRQCVELSGTYFFDQIMNDDRAPSHIVLQAAGIGEALIVFDPDQGRNVRLTLLVNMTTDLEITPPEGAQAQVTNRTRMNMDFVRITDKAGEGVAEERAKFEKRTLKKVFDYRVDDDSHQGVPEIP